MRVSRRLLFSTALLFGVGCSAVGVRSVPTFSSGDLSRSTDATRHGGVVEQKVVVAAYRPPAAPTPVSCGGGIGQLTACFQLPPFDAVSVPETSTDVFCFGNPQGTWYLQESNSPLLPQFQSSDDVALRSTVMTLTAPANATGTTQVYSAIPMIGKNGASTAEVDIRVPGALPVLCIRALPRGNRSRG